MYDFKFQVDLSTFGKLIEDRLGSKETLSDNELQNVINYIAGLYWNNQNEIFSQEIDNLVVCGQMNDAIRG